MDNGKEEKAFIPDQNKQDDQGFDARNQYSGSGSFSPDEQEEPSNEKGNLEKITGDLNSIKPDEVIENNTDTNESEEDLEKEEE